MKWKPWLAVLGLCTVLTAVAQDKPPYVADMEKALSATAQFAVNATRKSGGFVPFALAFDHEVEEGKTLQLPAKSIAGNDVETLSGYLAHQVREYLQENPEMTVATLARTYHTTDNQGAAVSGFLVFVDHVKSPAGLLYFIPLLQRSPTEYYLGDAVQRGTQERLFATGRPQGTSKGSQGGS